MNFSLRVIEEHSQRWKIIWIRNNCAKILRIPCVFYHPAHGYWLSFTLYCKFHCVQNLTARASVTHTVSGNTLRDSSQALRIPCSFILRVNIKAENIGLRGECEQASKARLLFWRCHSPRGIRLPQRTEGTCIMHAFYIAVAFSPRNSGKIPIISFHFAFAIVKFNRFHFSSIVIVTLARSKTKRDVNIPRSIIYNLP